MDFLKQLKAEEKMKKMLHEVDDKLSINFDYSYLNEKGASGSYNRNKSIIIRWAAVEQEKNKFEELGFQTNNIDLAWMVFVHELGHHIDWMKNQFKEYEESENILMEKVYKGEYDKLKDDFKIYYKEKMKMEEKAWELGEQYLPEHIDKKLYNQFKKVCLYSYEKALKRNFRYYIIQAKLIKLVDKVLSKDEEYEIFFTQDLPDSFNKRKKQMIVNLAFLATREKTKKRFENPIHKKAIEMLDKLIEAKEVEYPYHLENYNDMGIWKKEQVKNINESIESIEEKFVYDENFLTIYKNFKIKKINIYTDILEKTVLREEEIEIAM